MTREDLQDAARAELLGYWSCAASGPWWWLDPVLADLGLTSIARGRHTLATGELLTKTEAVEDVHAPAWLRDQLRARRLGGTVTSPRSRTALHASRVGSRSDSPDRPGDRTCREEGRWRRRGGPQFRSRG